VANKKGRINEIVQRNLSEIILYKLKAPITQFASVNEVRVSDDYSYCKVYVSHIDPNKADELVSYLNHNKGKIRTLLAQTLSIYKTPELSFLKDETYEKGKKIDDLIDKALNEKPLTLKDLEEKEKKEAKKTKKASPKKTVKAAKKTTAKKKTATRKKSAKTSA